MTTNFVIYKEDTGRIITTGEALIAPAEGSLGNGCAVLHATADPLADYVQNGEVVPLDFAVVVAEQAARDEFAAKSALSKIRAFKRAFNIALDGMAATGNLAAVYPSATTMLDLVEAFAADMATAALATALGITEAEVIGVQRARRDITEYLRGHPDVAALQAIFGLTDTQVDDLFAAAMAVPA